MSGVPQAPGRTPPPSNDHLDERIPHTHILARISHQVSWRGAGEWPGSKRNAADGPLSGSVAATPQRLPGHHGRAGDSSRWTDWLGLRSGHIHGQWRNGALHLLRPAGHTPAGTDSHPRRRFYRARRPRREATRSRRKYDPQSSGRQPRHNHDPAERRPRLGDSVRAASNHRQESNEPAGVPSAPHSVT